MLCYECFFFHTELYSTAALHGYNGKQTVFFQCDCHAPSHELVLFISIVLYLISSSFIWTWQGCTAVIMCEVEKLYINAAQLQFMPFAERKHFTLWAACYLILKIIKIFVEILAVNHKLLDLMHMFEVDTCSIQQTWDLSAMVSACPLYLVCI